jgi:16S rRNA (cytidine1402-2'-O)-methyltransferase
MESGSAEAATPTTAGGTLYLVPTALGEGAPEAVLPRAVMERVATLTVFVVETAKTARAHLKWMSHPGPMQALELIEIGGARDDAAAAMLNALRRGTDVGLMSDAGCPGVADPGAAMVRAARAQGHRIVPLTGPSSLLLALMGSGLEGQRFRFVGYLPADAAARESALRDLESVSKRRHETQIFIETPYRNDALLGSALKVLQRDTALCVAIDVTGPEEAIETRRVGGWRERPPAIGKRPTVFLLLA